jgi:hypothetical protein
MKSALTLSTPIRYMRTIGYGSKGKAETVEKQGGAGTEIGRYCSLRTTVRGKVSTHWSVTGTRRGE